MSFFHGWRRKTGSVTLFVACLLMIGWLRSLYFTHAVSVVCAGRENFEGFASIDRHFVWMKTAPADYKCGLLPDLPRSLPQYTQPKNNWPLGPAGFGNPAIQWSWRIGQFGVGTLPLKNGNIDWQIRFFTFSWWSVVVPLTAMSAWLLIGTPKWGVRSPSQV